MEQTHCGHCGQKFGQEKDWPRTCTGCDQTTWKNPIPAVMTLVGIRPMRGRTATGVLCIRRGIEPGKGILALPGGFVEVGEPWREAASRELYEETGIRVSPSELHIMSVESNDSRDRLLLFCRPYIMHNEDSLPEFIPSEEATERVVITDPKELSWPSHEQAVRDFFNITALSSSGW